MKDGYMKEHLERIGLNEAYKKGDILVIKTKNVDLPPVGTEIKVDTVDKKTGEIGFTVVKGGKMWDVMAEPGDVEKKK